MRFYQKEFPEPGDYVVAKIENVNRELGIKVSLLEYENKEAMIHLAEISRKKKVSLNKIVKENQIHVLEVVKVDIVNGFIDLSKKRVSPESEEKANKRYNNFRNAIDIMKFLERKLIKESNYSLNNLMSTIIWPNMDFDYLKSFRDIFWSFTEEEWSTRGLTNEMYSLLKEKVHPLEYTCKYTVKINCFSVNGVLDIQKAFLVAESFKEVECYLEASPNYVLVSKSSSKEDSIKKVKNMYSCLKDQIMMFDRSSCDILNEEIFVS